MCFLAPAGHCPHHASTLTPADTAHCLLTSPPVPGISDFARVRASGGRRGRLLPPLLSIKGLEQRRAHRGRSASVCPRKGPCYHGALARTARLGGEEREPDSTFGRQLTSSQPHAAKPAREGARDPGRGAERTWSEACAGPTSRGAGGASAPLALRCQAGFALCSVPPAPRGREPVAQGGGAHLSPSRGPSPGPRLLPKHHHTVLAGQRASGVLGPDLANT